MSLFCMHNGRKKLAHPKNVYWLRPRDGTVFRTRWIVFALNYKILHERWGSPEWTRVKKKCVPKVPYTTTPPTLFCSRSEVTKVTTLPPPPLYYRLLSIVSVVSDRVVFITVEPFRLRSRIYNSWKPFGFHADKKGSSCGGRGGSTRPSRKKKMK